MAPVRECGRGGPRRGGDVDSVGWPYHPGGVASHALAGWWGYAEGDPTAVGVVVLIVVLAGLLYVGQRLWRSRG